MKSIYGVAMAIMLLLVSCVKDDEDENIGVGAGDSLPAFSVSLGGGGNVNSADLRGKVAVIVFFSTECNDCRRELPVMQEVYEGLADDPDVAFVAISREEEPGAAARYWSEHGLTIPMSEQPDRAVYNLFATVGVPRIYIADADGRITAVFDDLHAPAAAQLLAAIAAAR
ncbi:MAG: TlpA family protein disulfide reductase [Muribaculaceae bacterium]|nr:TlpA family protein disulfide reductase [Muribaculaceae bacterium]